MGIIRGSGAKVVCRSHCAHPAVTVHLDQRVAVQVGRIVEDRVGSKRVRNSLFCNLVCLDILDAPDIVDFEAIIPFALLCDQGVQHRQVGIVHCILATQLLRDKLRVAEYIQRYVFRVDALLAKKAFHVAEDGEEALLFRAVRRLQFPKWHAAHKLALTRNPINHDSTTAFPRIGLTSPVKMASEGKLCRLYFGKVHLRSYS